MDGILVSSLSGPMSTPRPLFSKLDVYALVDADSNEAKQFQTYSFYWRQLERAIEQTYGADPVPAVAAVVTGTKAFRRLSATQYTGSADTLTHLLHNSWANELMLYVVDDGDPRLLLAVQWQNVYVYYATGMSAMAWLCVRDGAPPKAHRRLLDGLAAQISTSQLIPPPWNLHLAAHQPPEWRGFAAAPRDCSNLSSVSSVDPLDAIGKMLKTTRGKAIDLRADERRAKNGGRLRNGERAGIDAQLSVTTTFDFVWRSRTRANYGSPAMFFKGSLGDVSSCVAYITALKRYADATMLLFEAFVGQRARATLVDAATEFIARDRSQQSDMLVGRRLRELGYLK